MTTNRSFFWVLYVLWMALFVASCGGTDNIIPPYEVIEDLSRWDRDSKQDTPRPQPDTHLPGPTDTTENPPPLDVAPVAMVNNRDVLPRLLTMLSEAKSEIWVAQLEFLEGRAPDLIFQHLTDAADRGVEVHVILDRQVDANPPRVNLLMANRVDARLGSSARTLHTKIVVVDQTEVLVGSTNFSSSSMYYNNETNWYFNDSALGAIYHDYAKDLFYDSAKLHPIHVSPIHNITPIGDGQYAEMVMPIINSAKNRLVVIMYDMNIESSHTSDNGNLARAVISAHRRGVDTRVILELSSWNNHLNDRNQDAYNQFVSAGVPVRRDPVDVVTHAKTLVADNTVVIYTGNWLYSSMQRNHETGAICDNKKIADEAIGYFDKIWN